MLRVIYRPWKHSFVTSFFLSFLFLSLLFLITLYLLIAGVEVVVTLDHTQWQTHSMGLL
jgi:hypothetical protein